MIMSLGGNKVCPEEDVAQSDSPFGKVEDSELMARILHPNAHKNGRIQTSVLKVAHLQENGGWSFVRKNFANMSAVLARHANKKGRPASTYACVAVKAGDMRAILDSQGIQAFCVIDDALNGDPAHALVKESIKRPESIARKIRDKVIPLFGSIEQ